jgi:hypothetical protein
MPEDFSEPRLKFIRAQHHINELIDTHREFLKVQTFKAVADFNIEPGNIVWVAYGQQTIDHREFSPMIGDVLHNLRDCLDLAMSVLMRNAGESDGGVYFPTGDSRSNFEKAIGKGLKAPKARKVPNFPLKVISKIERLEPYKGGSGYWLRTLHNLAIADKHRLLIPTVFGLDTVHITVEGKGEIPMHFWEGSVPIKDGSKLARMRASQWPEIKSNQEARMTLSVEFDGSAEELRRWSIVDGCIRLMNVTEDAFDSLADCL